MRSPSAERGSRRAGRPAKRRARAMAGGQQHGRREDVLAQVVGGREPCGQHAVVRERPAARTPPGRTSAPRAAPRGGRSPARRSRRGRPRAAGRRPGPPSPCGGPKREADELREALARRVGQDLVAARARRDQARQAPQLRRHEAEGDRRERRDQRPTAGPRARPSGHLGQGLPLQAREARCAFAASVSLGRISNRSPRMP